jgi:transposase
VGAIAGALTQRLFRAWRACRDDHHDRTLLTTALQPVQAEVRTVLEQGTTNADARTQGLCRALLALWPALWPFIAQEGVEPTNTAAERALRPAVLWRKGSFGTQSVAGARFVARLLTVAATCRQQGRNLLDYLTEVCTAAHRGHAIPSLLPTPALPQGP